MPKKLKKFQTTSKNDVAAAAAAAVAGDETSVDRPASTAYTVGETVGDGPTLKHTGTPWVATGGKRQKSRSTLKAAKVIPRALARIPWWALLAALARAALKVLSLLTFSIVPAVEILAKGCRWGFQLLVLGVGAVGPLTRWLWPTAAQDADPAPDKAPDNAEPPPTPPARPPPPAEEDCEEDEVIIARFLEGHIRTADYTRYLLESSPTFTSFCWGAQRDMLKDMTDRLKLAIRELSLPSLMQICPSVGHQEFLAGLEAQARTREKMPPEHRSPVASSRALTPTEQYDQEIQPWLDYAPVDYTMRLAAMTLIALWVRRILTWFGKPSW